MNDTINRFSRALSVAGFSILAGFFGVGVTWIAVAGYAAAFKSRAGQEEAITRIMPWLIAVGVAGLIVGLMVSLRVAKADRETEQRVVAKYVGGRGQLKVYFGFPILLFVATMPFSERISHLLRTNHVEYIDIGLLMASMTIGLFFYDYIPRRFIMPVGIIGWLLLVMSAFVFAVFGC